MTGAATPRTATATARTDCLPHTGGKGPRSGRVCGAGPDALAGAWGQQARGVTGAGPPLLLLGAGVRGGMPTPALADGGGPG